MIDIPKGYKVGDEVFYYHTWGTFKRIKPPVLTRITKLNTNIIGANIAVTVIGDYYNRNIGDVIYSHETNLYTPHEENKVLTKYFKDLMNHKNSLPKKVRKRMKKFFNLHPEYLI